MIKGTLSEIFSIQGAIYDLLDHSYFGVKPIGILEGNEIWCPGYLWSLLRGDIESNERSINF